MKIAVASNDCVNVSPHFGRCSQFIVFEIKDGSILNQEIRDNTFTVHAMGECESGEHHHDQPHSHAQILDALKDCQVILCGGMGWRAVEDLKSKGLNPIIVNSDYNAQDAVNSYLKGEIKESGPSCSCHH